MKSKNLARIEFLEEYKEGLIQETNDTVNKVNSEITYYRNQFNEERTALKVEQDIEAYGCYMIDCGWSLACPECRVFKGLTSLGRSVYGVHPNRVVADKLLLNVVTGETRIFKDNKDLVFRGIVKNQKQLNLNVFQTLHNQTEW